MLEELVSAPFLANRYIGGLLVNKVQKFIAKASKLEPPPRSSKIKVLKDFIAANKLSVNANIGGKAKRTKDEIYDDILTALEPP